MVKQVKPLSDVENIGFGLLCGFTDVALFQPMNYWKNAVQQSLPFTLNPSLLYRGVAANLANNSFCVGAQFWLNGVWRKMITGGVNRDLSNIEKVGGGVFAGAASSVVAGPIELVMIQQQRKGGTLLDTTLKMLQGGHIFRGTIAMAAREGLCAAAQFSGAQFWRATRRNSLTRCAAAAARSSTLLLMGPPTSAVTTATPAPVGGAAVRLSVDLDGLEVGSSEWQRAARDSITNAVRAPTPLPPAGPRQPGSRDPADRPPPLPPPLPGPRRACGGGDGARGGARGVERAGARARGGGEGAARRRGGRADAHRAGAGGVDGGGDVGGRRGEGGGAAGGGAVARCRALCARGRQPRRRRARGGGGGRADVAAQIAPPRRPAAHQAPAAIESGRERERAPAVVCASNGFNFTSAA